MIPPETTTIEALLYAARKTFPTTVKKLGVWRPLIVAVLSYLGWDSHQGYQRHEREIENVKAFVQAPPTNGRRLHEVPEPPMPPTNRNLIRRK